MKDFVEAETHARDHVRRHPETAVQILRFVPLLSPEVRDYRAKLFAAPVSWTLMGYDPLVQALHPDDAVQALLHALDRPEVRGVFNVAPEGILPLSTVRLFFGSLGIPVPHGLAYALYEAAWLAGVGVMPGVHAHYLRYLCVVSNDKARRGARLRAAAHDARLRARDRPCPVRGRPPRRLRRPRRRGEDRGFRVRAPRPPEARAPAPPHGGRVVSATRTVPVRPLAPVTGAPEPSGGFAPSLLPKREDDLLHVLLGEAARFLDAHPELKGPARRGRPLEPLPPPQPDALARRLRLRRGRGAAVARAVRLPLHGVVARDALGRREHPAARPRAPRRQPLRRPAVGRRDGQARDHARAPGAPRRADAHPRHVHDAAVPAAVAEAPGRGPRLSGERGAAPEPRRARRRLPRGRQGRRQALPRPLPARAFRPRRLRPARAPHGRADHSGHRRRRRGDLPESLPHGHDRPPDRPAVFPDHAVLPGARARSA